MTKPKSERETLEDDPELKAQMIVLADIVIDSYLNMTPEQRKKFMKSDQETSSAKKLV